MDSFTNIIAILGLIALILLLKLWKRANHNISKGKQVPEVAGGFPIIGHMHLLTENKSLGRIFGNFADKYGPIFSLKLGIHRAIFISDQQALKDCFTTNDTIIAYRPPSTQAKFVGYNNSSFGMAPYGPYWRNMRKLAATELLSKSRTKMLNYVPISELNYLMKDLYDHRKENIDMSECIQRMILNVITRIVAGKRVFESNIDDGGVESRGLSQIIRELIDVTGQLIPGDVIPFIGWLDIKGLVKTLKNISGEVGSIVDEWIQEHKKNVNKSEDRKDFIDVMLSQVTDDASMGLDQATIIKGTTTTIIIAGSDTTAVTMTWALSNLLNNKKSLHRCQEELDLKVGRNRCVQVEDLDKLHYLSAVIKESMRLYPVGPLGVPRLASEDCHISRYYIPKGTRLFFNLWKLHRDPKVWSNPDEFIPERFLNEKSHLDVMGQNLEYLPFGAGRRYCPGTNFAMQVLSLSLARLLQGFEFATPNNEAVDMTEGQNMTMAKVFPLQLILTPRLDKELYDQECN
ncbi:cytochrome P450 CYP82J17-like [Euphorbia lathyris]|uniref:cytochrome P450 CYP82J17-like n=1 Tax=Euphorbia lathyris TaxID=212925 RepID=UPI00331356B2